MRRVVSSRVAFLRNRVRIQCGPVLFPHLRYALPIARYPLMNPAAYRIESAVFASLISPFFINPKA
jgi:hypothetical protein